MFLAHYQDVKNGCNISFCCKAANVSRGSYYKWRKADADFDAACVETEEQFYDWLEQQLYHSVQEGNVTAQIFALCNKAKQRGWQHVQAIVPPPSPPQKIEIEIVGRSTELPMPRKQVVNEVETAELQG